MLASSLGRCSPLVRHSAAVASRANVASFVDSRRAFASTPGKMKAPVRVAITGAAGQIGYALAARVACGDMLGADQPVILHLLELPGAMKALEGVCMELNDCAFPTLFDIVQTDDLGRGFVDVDFAMLVGARPRGPGMERKDLLTANAAIFTAQGDAINKKAKRTCKTVVVGNPANTNALIAANSAPDMPEGNFTAMTRLDHNRALAQLAQKTACKVTDIEKFVIWGNHSTTMYPDVSYASIKGASAAKTINDAAWTSGVFIPKVQKRGAEIIAARGLSSAMSAASSAIDHIRDWELGTNGKWVSMAVPSDGSYGFPKGLMISVPVTCSGGQYHRVQNLQISAESRAKIDISIKELQEEKAGVQHLLR